MKQIKYHLGLDVHKESITIAIAEDGPKGEVRLVGTISNDLHAVEETTTKPRRAHPGAALEAFKLTPASQARRLLNLQKQAAKLGLQLVPTS